MKQLERVKKLQLISSGLTPGYETVWNKWNDFSCFLFHLGAFVMLSNGRIINNVQNTHGNWQ